MIKKSSTLFPGRRRIQFVGRIFPAVLFVGACLALALSAAEDEANRNAILNHLNSIIGWYHDAVSNVAPGELPSDAIFQQNVRALAAQAVQLAFEGARAQAALASAPGASGADNDASPQDYSRVQTQAAQRITDAQAQLETIDKQIATAASVAKRKTVVAQRDELNGQISLDKARLETIQKMSQFVELNTESSKGLEGAIKELSDSVPEVVTQPGSTAAQTQKPSQTVAPITARGGGIVGQLVTLYDQVESMRAINHLQDENARVIKADTAEREPLRVAMRSLIAPAATEQPNATQPAAGSTPAAPEDFAKATKQFNQLSAALLPLSQELIVLQQARSDLQEWRSSISGESRHDLIALLFRVVGICLALGVVWAFADVWRRLTFRYVQDARRRRQFLVLRRFVMGFFFVMIVVLGFVSELGSLATYAGFVTAGIAVGLQTLLLSVAAYFFVVGRYGIRIGDRISIAGVTGDVVDVGLVRLYIMELAGTGVDLYPTGRIAVFSNSVLFQPSTPLFKQLPGTDYAWHEVSIAVAPAADHTLVHDKALAAINSVYNGYRAAMEGQQGTMGDRVEIVLKAPAPEAKYQLTGDGLALVIRYPVLLSRASEIDDSMTQALIDIITSDGAVKTAITGTPRIQAAVKG